MKNTGIIRIVDSLGRFVIPVELRKQFGIKVHDVIQIHAKNNMIFLKKYHTECFLCENTKDLFTYEDKLVCKKCIENLKKLEG